MIVASYTTIVLLCTTIMASVCGARTNLAAGTYPPTRTQQAAAAPHPESDAAVEYMQTEWMSPEWRSLWSLPGRIGLSMLFTYTTNPAELYHQIMQTIILRKKRAANAIAVLIAIMGRPFATQEEVMRTYIARILLQFYAVSPAGAYSNRPARTRRDAMAARVSNVLRFCAVVPAAWPGVYRVQKGSGAAAAAAAAAADAAARRVAAASGAAASGDGGTSALPASAATHLSDMPAGASAHTVSLVSSECSSCGRALCQHVLAARLVHRKRGEPVCWIDYEETSFLPDDSAPRETLDEYTAKYAQHGAPPAAAPRSAEEVSDDLKAHALFLAEACGVAVAQLQRAAVAATAAAAEADGCDGAEDGSEDGDTEDRRQLRQEAQVLRLQRAITSLKSVTHSFAALLGEQRPPFSTATAKLPTARTTAEVRARFDAARALVVAPAVAAGAQRGPTPAATFALLGPGSVGRPGVIPRLA